MTTPIITLTLQLFGVSLGVFLPHIIPDTSWTILHGLMFQKSLPDVAAIQVIKYDQLECCQKILSTEIKILSPKVVVFLTGESWAKDFIEYLGGGCYPPIVSEQEWGGVYNAKLYRLDKYGIILTEHPQTKEETTHVEAIKSLIELI